MATVIKGSQIHFIMTMNIKNSSNNTLNSFINSVLNIEEQKEVKGGNDTIIVEEVVI